MIYLAEETYDKLTQGIDYICKAIEPTLGPLGKNVAFDPKMDVPYVINSGKEIAKHINFEDKAVMTGVDIVKQAMEKAFWTAGDGTVATAALVHNIWSEGMRNIAAGSDPMAIMRGIRKASDAAVAALEEKKGHGKERSEILGVAKTSAGGRDDIADIVVKIYDNIGPDGYVVVEDSQAPDTHISYYKGVRWDKGYLGHFEEDNITFENPKILLVNRVLSKFEELAPVLKEAREKGECVVILARELKDDLRNAIHYIYDQGAAKVVAVEAPGHGDVRNSIMKYWSIMFGAKLFDDMTAQFGEMTLADCGHADKIVVNKKETKIQGIPNPDDPEVLARRVELMNDLEHIKDEDERYRIEQMLTVLGMNTAEVLVGGYMEMEMFERKYLLDNAVHTTQNAVRYGYLPGGGKGYILAIPAVTECAKNLTGDEKTGAMIFARALEVPAFRLAENSGYDGKSTVAKLKNSKDDNLVFDVLTEKFVNCMDAGLLDSAAAIESAIETAASSVSTALSISACVTAKDPEKDE